MNPILHNDDKPDMPELCYQEFDWEELNARLFPGTTLDETAEEFAGLDPETREAAYKMFRYCMTWLWFGGRKNSEGFSNRSVILCWHFIEYLRQETLEGLASHLNKDKQSLGRAHDEFKAAFPFIRTAQQTDDKKKGHRCKTRST